MDIGKGLEDLMKQRGFNQSSLGRAAGIAREYVNRIIKGVVPNPNPQTLKRLLDPLNYKLSDLFKAIGE